MFGKHVRSDKLVRLVGRYGDALRHASNRLASLSVIELYGPTARQSDDGRARTSTENVSLHSE